jgi:hypothetical protein
VLWALCRINGSLTASPRAHATGSNLQSFIALRHFPVHGTLDLFREHGRLRGPVEGAGGSLRRLAMLE